jgi:hypothetical protein
LPALACVVGRTIAGIAIVEYLFRTEVQQDFLHPENVGLKREAWLLHALEFHLGEDRLQIFNALDENGVTLDPPVGPEFRRTLV